MKYFNPVILALVLIISSCAKKDELESKKEKLKELKQEAAELSLKIKKLETEILAVDQSYSKRKLILVDTMKLMPSGFTHSFKIHGTVESDNSIQVNPEINGTIEDVKVSEGTSVKKGQVLAVLNTDVISQSIREVQTGLELANTVFEKQKRLWEQKVGTEIQYLQAKNQKESLEEKLSTLRTQLSMGIVKSPINGVVDDVFHKQGEMASPMVPLFRVVNTKSSEIKAELSESYLGKVKKGDKVKVDLPTMNKSVKGVVTAVGQYINPANRTFAIRVSVGENTSLLKPNMLATIQINDYEDDDAIVVPSDVIQYDQKGNFVFVVQQSVKEPSVKKTYVKTGLANDDGTVITSGLKEGDVIVKKGHRAITDGEKVRLKK